MPKKNTNMIVLCRNCGKPFGKYGRFEKLCIDCWEKKRFGFNRLKKGEYYELIIQKCYNDNAKREGKITKIHKK